MNSSGSTTRSAPSAAARARAVRALAALPSTSPTVGLSWASVMTNSWTASVMGGWCTATRPTATLALDHAHAFGDGEEPEQAGHDQGQADRGRSHVLDVLDLLVAIGGQPVGQFLDRGVKEFDHQDQHDRANQLDPAHGGGAY